MNRKFKSYKTVLSIAGSDSIGGAGIQADIKTCCSLGVYAMTVITAVTAQNTKGVDSFEAVSPELLRAQLKSVFADVVPDAIKIGMIPDAESVNIIADELEKLNPAPKIVLDPVMVATSGDKLFSSPTLDAMRARLFPIATVITPNIHEAEAISGHLIDDKNFENSAKEILNHTPVNAVYLKGGHLIKKDNRCTIDVLNSEDSGMHTFENEVVDTVNTHGTGCSLSTAIACYLAKGKSLPEACDLARMWLHSAIENGKDYSLGHGHGPVNHLEAKAEI